MIKASFVQPFRIGDVCEYTGESAFWTGEHIVQECTFQRIPHYEYATTLGAWINHEDLKLVRECDEASMKQLQDNMGDEE